MKKQKRVLKRIIKLNIIFFIILISAMILLLITSMIPRKNIENNVKESSQYLNYQELSQEIGLKGIRLDNFTDAVMINAAYSVEEHQPFQSMILARISYDEKRDLTELKSSTTTNEIHIVHPIKDLQENLLKTNRYSYQYARYWHGYLIFLRPLLLLFNYFEIKILFNIIVNLLAILLVYYISKQASKKIAILFAIMLLCFSYYYVGLSITYFSTTIIFMLFSIYIIKTKKINCEMFFAIGCLTSFFDLLTTPLLTFGIPILVYFAIDERKVTYIDIIKLLLSWVMGYALFWFSKWVITDCLYNKNIISEALMSIQERTGGEKILFKNVLINNFETIRLETIILIIFTIICLFLWKKKKIDISIKEMGKMFIIGILPFVWFFCTQNHSIIHAGYTYRILLITYISIGLIDIKILEKWNKTGEKKSEKTNLIKN